MLVSLAFTINRIWFLLSSTAPSNTKCLVLSGLLVYVEKVLCKDHVWQNSFVHAFFPSVLGDFWAIEKAWHSLRFVVIARICLFFGCVCDVA
jgi:hypothetical protein